MWVELARSIQEGNGYMIAMLVVAFLAMVFVFERLFMLLIVYNIDYKKFLSAFKKMINSNDLDRAVNLCKGASHTSLPKIARKAVEAAQTDPSSVKGTIEEETISFLPRIEARIEMLPALATITLLLGILGTIDGLWSSFHSINVLDTARKQASLSTGIAGSLNPTAFGLFAGMLVLFFHQIVKSLAVKLTDNIHLGVSVLNNVLVPDEVHAVMAAPVMPVAQAAAPEPAIADAHNDGEADAAAPEVDGGFDDAAIEDIKDEEEII